MVCPKCGAQIKRFELSPNCKSCGVNMFYYSQEQELARDAKRTELEFANARALVAKLKGNFIGGKVPISRIVFLVLTVAVMCIPYFSINISLPMAEIGFSTGLVGAYQIYDSSAYMAFLPLFRLKIGGAVTVAAFINMALFLITALIVVAMLVVFLLSFINIRKSAKSLAVLSFVGIVTNLGAFAAMLVAKLSAQGYDGLNVSFCFGSLVCAAMLLVYAILNISMAKNGSPAPLRDVDVKRIELYKQYKKKELDLDSLPLPIYETPEEREKRLNAIPGYKKEEKEGEQNG